MSVLDISPTELFSVRVIMQQPAITPVRWANTWEVQANEGATETDLETFMVSLAEFHRQLLRSYFLVERVVASTLVPDSTPYNPDNLFVLERATVGAVSGGELEPLTTCLFIKRQTSSGRLGNLLIRGYLGESDTSTSGSGTVGLTSFSATQIAVDGAIDASSLDNYFDAGEANFTIVMAGTSVVHPVRRVTGLLVQGITYKKLNNKFFNR